ncbi:MAG: hypothetical protein HY275_13050 [Gemmatimonadetes bacterium]|nr:hypothetical protein [Gemmatimonadota bacterium]
MLTDVASPEPFPPHLPSALAMTVRTLIRAASLATALPAALALAATLPSPARAQDARAQVLALADSGLAAISRGDWVAFTDLMVPEAMLFPTREVNGAPTYAPRTREQQRTASGRTKITERGWNGEARVAGLTATVWLPYDLHIDGKWSHCGVDTFLFVKTATGWKISAMTWSVEQPPACAKHPNGPPTEAR